MEIKAPKGTRDIFAPEIYRWQYVEQLAREHFKRYNYTEIRTPIFEHIELFQRSIGETTEIVNKQMYVFNDLGGRSLVLRPENTAAIVRALIENNLLLKHASKRYYYIAPMFRYEKMQKGRYRQFHQIGVEVFDEKNPLVDVEVIQVGLSFLEKINCSDLELQISSVGCKKCRPLYNKILTETFINYSDKLCEDCKIRLERNPLRILDCKKTNCLSIIKQAPQIYEYLCSECKEHFEKVKFYLTEYKIPFKLNPYLVRGLDYYTKTAFEINSGILGSQNAILGGGRYDGLVYDLGGPDICGIGFAIGLERILMSMKDFNEDFQTIDYCIIPLIEEAKLIAFKLTTELRNNNYIAEMMFDTKSLRSALRYANKIKAKKALIIGEEEFKNNSVSIKDMETGNQFTEKIEIFLEKI